MVNISKLDFSGQHLYVGLDVHKKSWSVSISICHSGANVLLYDNGSLKACQLENDYDANGIQCKSNNPASFYNNGNLESCVLSKPATLDMNKCKEDGLVSFYIDGKLKSCVKPDN